MTAANPTATSSDLASAEPRDQGLDEREERFSIGEMCEAFGATPRALRFYEDQGLLSPERDDRRRIYSARDRARLKLILRGKRFGFSLLEIKELLDLYDLGDRQATQLRRTLETAATKLSELRSRREELDAAISDLVTHMALVEEMIAAGDGRNPSSGEPSAALR